jgi:hypothetical protein
MMLTKQQDVGSEKDVSLLFHDLRNHLNVILGNCDVLARGSTDCKSEERMEKIRRTIEVMTEKMSRHTRAGS